MRATDGNPSPSLFSVDTRDGAGVAERAERRRFRIVCDYSVLAGCWVGMMCLRASRWGIFCVCVCVLASAKYDGKNADIIILIACARRWRHNFAWFCRRRIKVYYPGIRPFFVSQRDIWVEYCFIFVVGWYVTLLRLYLFPIFIYFFLLKSFHNKSINVEYIVLLIYSA